MATIEWMAANFTVLQIAVLNRLTAAVNSRHACTLTLENALNLNVEELLEILSHSCSW